jgi:hypothetical protein
MRRQTGQRMKAKAARVARLLKNVLGSLYFGICFIYYERMSDTVDVDDHQC